MGLEHAIPLASYIFMPFDGSQLGLVFQPSSDLASALESPPASAAMFSHQAWTSPRLPVELLGTEKATSTASAVNLAFGIQLILDSHLSHLYCNGIHHSCGDMNEDHGPKALVSRHCEQPTLWRRRVSGEILQTAFVVEDQHLQPR